MMLHNIWFERAWKRWNARRELFAKLEREYVDSNVDNRFVNDMIATAMTVDGVLYAQLKQSTAVIWRFKLTLTINVTVHDPRRVLEKVQERIERIRPAVTHIDYEVFGATS